MAGTESIQWLTKLFTKLIELAKMPDIWRNSYLVPIFKNKGDVQGCENYRGIKLTSHTLKLWERVISKRLSEMVHITENQCGFVSGKSTIDAIQSVRIIVEKFRSQKLDLHMAFIDLEKAFDRVPRELLYHSLRLKKVPELYIAYIQDMYLDTTTQIKSPAGITQ